MSNKSIGQFIAALRKANGMTQLEVAERLNVSNKAVSRWERDECAPDISLIPALAEMFGVSCDELLKGERINNTNANEKTAPKIEKQLKTLVNRTLSSFKTLIWIAFALSAVGLICMFGISYGFYYPVVGFAVMLLFEAAAFVVTVIAVNRMKTQKDENELFENANEELRGRFDKCLGSFSFASFFSVVSVIVLSLPLILFSTSYVQSVLSLQSYFQHYFIIALLILAVIYFAARKPYISRVTDKPCQKIEIRSFSELKLMNIIQLGACVLASVMFFAASYFNVPPDVLENYQTVNTICNVLLIAGFAFLLCDIIVFGVFIAKHKEKRKNLMLSGIRNVLMAVPAIGFSAWHGNGYVTVADGYERYDYWDNEILFQIIVTAVVIFAVFKLIELFRKSRNSNL